MAWQVGVVGALHGVPTGFDGVEASGDGDDGGVVEELGEAFNVEGGRADDEAQVGAALEGAADNAEEEVDIE